MSNTILHWTKIYFSIRFNLGDNLYDNQVHSLNIKRHNIVMITKNIIILKNLNNFRFLCFWGMMK